MMKLLSMAPLILFVMLQILLIGVGSDISAAGGILVMFGSFFLFIPMGAFLLINIGIGIVNLTYKRKLTTTFEMLHGLSSLLFLVYYIILVLIFMVEVEWFLVAFMLPLIGMFFARTILTLLTAVLLVLIAVFGFLEGKQQDQWRGK